MSNKYKSKVFKEKVYPDVKKELDRRGDQYIRDVQRYIDRNSDVLLDSGISKRLFFRPNDINKVYMATRLREHELKRYIRETGETESHWEISNNPENWAFIMVIKYYHDKGDREKDKLTASVMYLTLSLYASLHYKYFPHLPNENVMSYTINNLSNKFYIKRLGNLFKALVEISMNSHETYAHYLDDENFSDRHILDYMINLRTRLNNFVQAISNEFYDNLENEKYLNLDSESRDEDDYYEVDNISYTVNKLADKTTNHILTIGLDRRISDMSARLTGVSMNVLRTAIDNIISNESETINELISLTLQQYLVVDQNPVDSINSNRFINYCNNLYASSNTREKSILRIKEILDEWLRNNSDRYVATERVATKSNFRKSTYFYFIFMIQQVNSTK